LIKTQGKIAESFSFMNKLFFVSARIFFSTAVIFSTACSVPKLFGPSQLSAVDEKVPEVQIAPREQVESSGKKWMVSTQGRVATDEAAKILKAGGTVIDAAIVASLVIGVERPQSTGIGGGGFMIYHEAKTGKNYVFDFRERAPAKASSKMYLNAKDEVVEGKSETGSLAIAVPGLVRGLTYIHSKFSHEDWRALVRPAQFLAEKGFAVYPSLAHALDEEKENLAKFPESKATFLHADGTPLKLGEKLVQKNLSNTLRILSAAPEDFYRGSIARKISFSVKRHGGLISKNDLATYTVKERKALEANWKGYKIVAMPPPSSGGVHVIQILKMLEHDDLAKMGFGSAQAWHLEACAMQQAFADRAKYLGDTDFVKVPLRGLIDDHYLEGLRAGFDELHAKSADAVSAGSPPADDELNTSHLTIMDQAGNVVVSTQTINGYFGSKLMAEGTGIMMNNEMDDFAAKPGTYNIFGATATTDANQIQPKKTPLSSMSPTILFDSTGKPVLALGAPGGTRIITSVAQTILNYVVFHQDLYHAIAAPRIHEQWKPDRLMIENQPVPVGVLDDLQKRGWNIQRTPAQSNVMAVVREGDTLIGVSDPRDIGTSKGE
jgi:gamma-glutamyltranspeptidase/glutathione hydrolase